MKRFVTAADVENLFQQGQTEIAVDPDTVISDIAQELAEKLGVRFVAPRPRPAAKTEHTPSLPDSVPAPAGVESGSVPATPPAAAPPLAFQTAFTPPDVDLAILNATAVIPGVAEVRADVLIRDGKILSLSSRAPGVRAGRTIDASGLFLLPGVVDPHIHLGIFAPLEEEMVTETRSAILGGVTTVGCFFGHRGSYLGLLDRWRSRVQELSSVDVIPHLVMTEPQHLEEMDQYIRMGVSSFKVYMSGIPGIIDEVDDGFILEVLRRARMSGKGCVVCVHAENSGLVRAATAKVKDEPAGRGSDLKVWEETHPDIAEEEAILRASFLSKKARNPVYIVHVSSKSGVEAVKKAKTDGVRIFAETTSSYLTVTSTSEKGLVAKMVPPLRDAGSVDALWEAMEQGYIDALGTDHVAVSLETKNVAGGIWEALPGYPALGTHLPVLLHEGVLRRRFPSVRLAELMTARPAAIFGVFPRKGSLLPGSDADLVLCDLNRTQVVRPEMLASRADFSLHDGHVIQGWPVMTIKGGVVVAEEGRLTGDKPVARLLTR